MEKILLILGWTISISFSQLQTFTLPEKWQVGDFQTDHMIYASKTDGKRVRFHNLLTHLELYNFTTPSSVVKIISHPDNTVSDLPNVRYLVHDGDLNYYGDNTLIHGPEAGVDALCFLGDKHSFSWVESSTLKFYPSGNQIDLGSYKPEVMAYGDGNVFTVGKDGGSRYLKQYSVAGLAELRSVSVDMPAKKDLEYVGNGHVAYANSVNLTFFKPSSDELSIEQAGHKGLSASIDDLEWCGEMLFVATSDKAVCLYYLYDFTEHHCITMNFALQDITLSCAGGKLHVASTNTYDVHIYDVDDFVDAALLPDPPQTNSTNSTNGNATQETEGNNSEVFKTWLSDKAVEEVLNITGSSLIIASSNTGYHIVRPLTGFLEDFWFYQYHDTKYPLNVIAFIEKVDLMNHLRLSPELVTTSTSLTVFQPEAERHRKLAKKMIGSGSLPKEVYFLESTKSIYAENFIYGAIFFIILQVLRFVFCWKKSENQIVKAIYNYLCHHTRWWNLLVSLIELNILMLTFSSFLQLLQPSSFNFENKMNLIAGVMVLFFNMMFTCVFYILLYNYEKQEHSQIMLTHGKYGRKGFYIEMFFNCFRNFLRGAFTALFIAHHEVQLCCLIATSVFLALVTIWLRKHFINLAMFLVSLIYYLAFMTFDLVLLVREKEYLPQLDYETLSLFLILLIFALVIIKIVMLVVAEIKDGLKFCKATRTVAPKGHVREKSTKKSGGRNKKSQKNSKSMITQKHSEQQSPAKQGRKMKILIKTRPEPDQHEHPSKRKTTEMEVEDDPPQIKKNMLEQPSLPRPKRINKNK